MNDKIKSFQSTWTFLAVGFLTAIFLAAAFGFLGLFAFFGVFVLFGGFAAFEGFGDAAAFFTGDFLVDADFLDLCTGAGNLKDPLAPKLLLDAEIISFANIFCKFNFTWTGAFSVTLKFARIRDESGSRVIGSSHTKFKHGSTGSRV